MGPGAVPSLDSLRRLEARLKDIPPRRALGNRKYNIPDDAIQIVITGHADLGSTGVRWKYSWHMLSLSGTDFETISDPANGYSGTTTVKFAINQRELTNAAEPDSGDPWPLAGIDAHGADYPAGFKIRPIGAVGTSDDHVQNIVVWAWPVQTSDKRIVMMFDELNLHDGTCDA